MPLGKKHGARLTYTALTNTYKKEFERKLLANYLGFAADGYFLPWAEWSACSVTCSIGHQTRQRICREPSYGGMDCEGPREEQRNCSQVGCPGNIFIRISSNIE